MLHSILDQATNVKETIPKIECSSLRDQPKVVAERKDHITSFHGRKLSDPYYWLRERENSAVRKLIDSENQYQKEKMKPLKNLQDTIFKEIKDRILQTDESVPYVWKDYLYYTRTEDGKDYKIYCRKALEEGSKEEILIDLNELSKELETDFLELGMYEISPDQKILAFSIDVDGDEFYDLYFKDLTNGKIYSFFISKDENLDTSFEFGNDSRTVVFAVCDEAHRPYRVYRKTLAMNSFVDKLEDCQTISVKEDCELIFEELDERFFVSVCKTLSEEFIFIDTCSNNTCEYHYIRTDDLPKDNLRLFANKKRKEGVEFYISHHTNHFYVWHNDDGYINFRLMRTPVENPDFNNLEEVLPYNPEFYTEDLVCFKDHLALFGRSEGVPKLIILDPHNVNSPKEVEFNEPFYELEPCENYTFDNSRIRIVYSSFITPTTTYEYDMQNHEFNILKQEVVLGDFDPNQYMQRKILVTARDGVKIPIGLVYKKRNNSDTGIELDGNNPLLLYGYGAYGCSLDAYFSHAIFSLLDRGFVYAIAGVRGGSENGRGHYQDGKLLKKKNSFYDFIDCAEYLIKEGWTNPNKLVIEGGSAGGLLIGGVLAFNPELFRAAILEDPFVDVINSLSDPSIPLSVTEYDEWGNPQNEKHFEYMLSYSPYDNMDKEENVEKSYPAILIDHALNDSRVQYWEGLKFVAKLRYFYSTPERTRYFPTPSLILCKTNMKQGHGGASQRYEAYKEIAYRYSFVISQVQQ
ncbi:hypothetical protein FDP41_002126 [Naegleria fowleri]|uniref:Prolyl endopeptidase n=1 Tax=Naegleria fowleri TaxID=5763 RepID=A0A6A5BUX7_NAEFO|nr:uncharacterized protein FDP41_002126 [Naegleria fowleri]KAF0979056.1 hypothetical protein FDP41_002126 [Naegleria fowleri]